MPKMEALSAPNPPIRKKRSCNKSFFSQSDDESFHTAKGVRGLLKTLGASRGSAHRSLESPPPPRSIEGIPYRMFIGDPP